MKYLGTLFLMIKAPHDQSVNINIQPQANVFVVNKRLILLGKQ